jgi:hypothetical protein
MVSSLPVSLTSLIYEKEEGWVSSEVTKAVRTFAYIRSLLTYEIRARWQEDQLENSQYLMEGALRSRGRNNDPSFYLTFSYVRDVTLSSIISSRNSITLSSMANKNATCIHRIHPLLENHGDRRDWT